VIEPTERFEKPRFVEEDQFDLITANTARAHSLTISKAFLKLSSVQFRRPFSKSLT